MAKYITEILTEINKNPSSISLYKDNYAIKTIMEYSFDPKHKMVLPEGTPPFKQDAAPLGMSQANFYQQVKKFYVFKRTDITSLRREQLFIQMLESLHPSEADICVAIKDQTLTKLYPNISRKLVEDNGFVPKSEKVVLKETPTKSGKQLVINIDDTATVKETFGTLPSQEVTKRPRGRPRKTQ